ncbi:hypothetical protein GCM10010913_41650 [Paenibacillus aceti]|uniref:Uncharacterized protein n=2 Tax=Paenibacillus aceti TaxID=1820010 RepID=A0ABQ1W6P0_9BACL|nr:hypothetical protein [Paenibacillus aceti]GGG15407.1 hypothetical protein GCM10010913_41650 [Paenibacillus aceti]
MSDNINECSEEITEQARLEYSLKVLSKVLNQVNAPSFKDYFKGQTLQEIMNSLVIVLDDDIKIRIEWLENRYSSLVKKSLKTVVRVQIDLLEIIKNEKSPEESELMSFIKLNKEKIEKHSVLYQNRKLQKDYEEMAVNLINCSCGCNNVENTQIDLSFPGQESIRGVTVKGAARCLSCKEQYFLQDTVKVIDSIEEMIVGKKRLVN